MAEVKEIAKCPRCCETPKRVQYKAGGFGYSCCGAEFFCRTYWNEYAAAMELAKTYVWEKEVVHLKHGNGWPAHISNDGISEIVLHEYKAWEDSKAAKKRVMDLFNTKQ